MTNKRPSCPQKPPYIQPCHRPHPLWIAYIALFKKQRDLRARVLGVHQLLRLRETRITVQQAAQIHVRHRRAENLVQHLGGLDRATLREKIVLASLVRQTHTRLEEPHLFF